MRKVEVGTYSFTSEFEFRCSYCEHNVAGTTLIQLRLVREDGSFKTTIVCSELCQMMTELKWLGD